MGRIICIGRRATGKDDDTRAVDFIADWLQRMGRLADLGKRIENGDLDLYDMSTLPKKGDGITALKRYKRVDAVIAVHLFGIDMDVHVSSPLLRMNGYYYNRRNHQLLDICMERGVKLLAWGDQPDYRPSRHPHIRRTQIIGSAYLYEVANERER